jgi:hypothetical protein
MGLGTGFYRICDAQSHPRLIKRSIIAVVLRGEPMKSEHTAQQVAVWMLEELKRQHKLHLDTVVFEITEKFGGQFTYDKKGNLAIRMDVLAAFRKLAS